MKQQVRHWLSIMGQHRYETAGFSLNLAELTDAELVNLKTVTANFLDFAPVMFQVVHPKQHAELRRAVAYLTELSELQNEAWGHKQKEFETRQQNVKQWVQKHTTNR